jgi:predicted DNA-binding transcriptional regulator AlpA
LGQEISMTQETENRRLTVQVAAKYTGVSASTLNKLRVYGTGPVFLKIGRRVAYDRADLDTWLQGKRRNSTSDDQ